MTPSLNARGCGGHGPWLERGVVVQPLDYGVLIQRRGGRRLAARLIAAKKTARAGGGKGLKRLRLGLLDAAEHDVTRDRATGYLRIWSPVPARIRQGVGAFHDTSIRGLPGAGAMTPPTRAHPADHDQRSLSVPYFPSRLSRHDLGSAAP